MVVMVILYHHEGLLIFLDFFLEGVGLIFRHPSAEDIEHIVLLPVSAANFRISKLAERFFR